MRLRRAAQRLPGPPAHRPHRPVRVRGRGTVRDEQPHHDRPLARAAAGAGPGPGGRAAGPLRADRRRRADGEDLLGRDAPPPGPGGQPGRPPPGAVPGRADHRTGPAQPQRRVGHDPRTGRGRGHGAAHHPVPGRGRPAGPRHRGHRPGQGHRDRDAGRAEGQGGRPGAPGRAGRSGPPARGRRAARGAGRRRGQHRRRGRRRYPRPSPTRRCCPRVARELDDRGIELAEFTLRKPSLDEVFFALTGHRAEDEETPARELEETSR